MKAFLALIRRDCILVRRTGGAGAAGLVFFISVVTLIPFALGPDLNLLSRIGPAILWIAALLATLISLDRLFQADEEDGTLDALRLSSLPLELVVLAKIVAHWLTTGLPLVLASPLMGLLVAMPLDMMALSFISLMIGTPALTFIGAIGAALTLSIRRGSLLLAVLVLPFMIPVLIFGVAAALGMGEGTFSPQIPMLVLAALSLTGLITAIWSCAMMLRFKE